VVLLHGMMSTAATWWRIGPALAERGWVVDALDLPGHGDWPPSERPLDLDMLVDGVAGRLDGPGDLLVGHSLGGAVAVALAGRRPGAARAVALEDPAVGLGGAARAALADGVEADARLVRRDRAQLPPDRFVVLDGGHCLHRDLPDRWLAVVGGFADAVLAPAP
jgi:pimeloyl-ACP methyl ester carboxylesterase